MELLIDTNVLLDLVLKRDNYLQASELFERIDKLGINAYISASAVTDLFFIIRRQTHDVEKTYQIMNKLLKLVSVLSVTSDDITSAFERKWRDFEDCVQYVTALNNHMGYIISSNTKDFEENKLQVLTIDDFLEKYSVDEHE